MQLARTAPPGAIREESGVVPLAVTTSLRINFLRKPSADRTIAGVGKCTKVGKSLAVGEVSLYSEGHDEPVAHVGTYSIPRWSPRWRKIDRSSLESVRNPTLRPASQNSSLRRSHENTRQSNHAALGPMAMKRSRGGVEYEDLKLGDGPTADRGAKVEVRYSLSLNRGEQAQESQLHAFRVGKPRLIPGLENGVEGMRVGGERRLRVPPHLAYRRQAIPGLAPVRTVLEFDVTLLRVDADGK